MSDKEQKKIFSRNLLRYLGNTPQNEVAKAIGVSPQTFNTWCQGIALPRMGKVQSLADYFGIKKSDLIEDKSISEQNITTLAPRLRPDEEQLLDGYNKLDQEDKAEVRGIVKGILRTDKYKKEEGLDA